MPLAQLGWINPRWGARARWSSCGPRAPLHAYSPIVLFQDLRNVNGSPCFLAPHEEQDSYKEAKKRSGGKGSNKEDAEKEKEDKGTK